MGSTDFGQRVGEFGQVESLGGGSRLEWGSGFESATGDLSSDHELGRRHRAWVGAAAWSATGLASGDGRSVVAECDKKEMYVL